MYDNLPIVKNNIASLNQFQTINISALGKSLYQMKSSICVLDIVPTKFLKKRFPHCWSDHVTNYLQLSDLGQIPKLC